ncbi:MAG TPA: multiheme c-type cytochrome, partial [Pirellulaceae bacterium]|nr:multiheme c-type cytochrome [Pirellulaceae bacterium]
CALPASPAMPPDERQWLTDGQLTTLHRWISRGAHEWVANGPQARQMLTELDFPSAKQCQACHPRQYEQWSRSPHAYGQISPVMEAMTQTLQERTGGTMGTFCTRCHTPQGTALGESGLMRNVNRTRLSLEGITCIACHRRAVATYKNNGRSPLAVGSSLETCMFGPFESTAARATGDHASVRQPFLTTSQFCSDCHEVTMPNGMRTQETFTEWQHSPAGKQNVTCQHCHMGPSPGLAVAPDARPLGRAAEVPGVPPESLPLRRLSDHSFAGPDYSLLPDTEFPERLDWMYETDYRKVEKLTPHQRRTLDELRRSNRKQLELASAARLELLSRAARLEVERPKQCEPGNIYPLKVTVHNQTSGHSFPTGFTAHRQAWVAIDVQRPDGSFAFRTGDVDEAGDLRDGHSAAVRLGKIETDRFLLSLQGKNTLISLHGEERSPILAMNRDALPATVVRPPPTPVGITGRGVNARIARNAISPLGHVTQTYPLPLVPGGGPYFVRVRLNYRHLEPAMLGAIGAPHLKKQIQTVVLAEWTDWVPMP